jgi:hypothetical protein
MAFSEAFSVVALYDLLWSNRVGPGGGKPGGWATYIYDGSPAGSATYGKGTLDWVMDYYYVGSTEEHVQVEGTGRLPP